MPETTPRSVGRTWIVAVPVLILLLPIGYSVVSSLFAQEAPVATAFLEQPDPKYKECVRDTTYMRFRHWELLHEVRKEVVRHGERGDAGLNRCRDCHTSRERFCNRCHDAVSLHPDCFGCHYYP